MPYYITTICPVCGNSYQANPRRLKYGRETTCSRKCSYAFRMQKIAHSNECTCLNCGTLFRIPVSRLNESKGRGKYCSRQCRDAHRIGVNHPQFIEESHTEHRGANWRAQRRRALKRDQYTCQRCGIIRDDLPADNQLHVHHTTPFRLFDTYLEANQLDNLQTLCGACHRIIEAELQREAS